ncbi:esterase-like activity of phytase family protein [Muricoccus nepalensis]|uniref:esterase-like activity of phytase family protein n=1 Tax=Muricoccus nepalensis TaxID=1854500 RepID=UPI0013875080|nr:esterase-like activity of phytase family protein [Roseomonas nepalensis]
MRPPAGAPRPLPGTSPAGLRRRRLGRRAALAALLGASACGLPPGSLTRPESLPEGFPDPLAGLPLRPLGVVAVDTERLGADGLSGLHVAPDLTLTAISDRGRWCQARLLLSPEGAPLGLEAPRSGPLRDIAGRPFQGFLGDAECLAALPDGSWLVGFERLHRIQRYRHLDGPAEPAPSPPGLAQWPGNGALESLGVLPDGRWLAIAESERPPGDEGARVAWIGGPRAWRRFAYRPAPGHDPSDLCPLPDGGALVLERHAAFPEGFSARLTRLPPLPDRPGTLEGELVARLAPPLPSDNWEGVSAFRHRGRDLVAVVSDDNQLFFQRTLLMVLAWTDQPAA